jgi:hypothetical protein
LGACAGEAEAGPAFSLGTPKTGRSGGAVRSASFCEAIVSSNASTADVSMALKYKDFVAGWYAFCECFFIENCAIAKCKLQIEQH